MNSRELRRRGVERGLRGRESRGVGVGWGGVGEWRGRESGGGGEWRKPGTNGERGRRGEVERKTRM